MSDVKLVDIDESLRSRKEVQYMKKYIKPSLEYVALRSEERIAGTSPTVYCYYMASPNTQPCDPSFHPHWDGPPPLE